jgi:hypothetical protein
MDGTTLLYFSMFQSWSSLISASRSALYRAHAPPMISRQFDFTVLLEIARLIPGGPLCRLVALKKISATTTKDATSTAPENA